MEPAGEDGSSIVAPAWRGKMAISVAGGDIVVGWIGVYWKINNGIDLRMASHLPLFM